MSAQLPKTGLGGALEDPLLKAQFRSACSTIWDSDIRNDLIFQKGLQLCGGCLGFFYSADKGANHPKDQTFQVSLVCQESRITSAETLFNTLWEKALEMAPKLGLMPLPRMSAKHMVAPKAVTVTVKEKETLPAQGKVSQLEQALAKMEEENKRLSGDKRAIEEQNQAMFARLMEEKGKLDRIKLSAERHINALNQLLHPDGCGCTGMCENGPEEEHK